MKTTLKFAFILAIFAAFVASFTSCKKATTEPPAPPAPVTQTYEEIFNSLPPITTLIDTGYYQFIGSPKRLLYQGVKLDVPTQNMIVTGGEKFYLFFNYLGVGMDMMYKGEYLETNYIVPDTTSKWYPAENRIDWLNSYVYARFNNQRNGNGPLNHYGRAPFGSGAFDVQ